MPARNVFHVMPSEDGSWQWRTDDGGVSKHFATRESALADAVKRAEKDPESQVLVHREDAAREVYRNVVIPPSAERHGVKSRVTVAGHPVHPMLIPFPFAFLTAALVSDLVFLATLEGFWARLSLTLIIGGLATGVLASLVGLVDFASLAPVRRSAAGWLHFLLNLGVLVLAFANLMVRYYEPAANLVPAGLTLSAITAALLLVSGVAGSHLVYKRRIGLEPHRG